jgi:hypothetical protein
MVLVATVPPLRGRRAADGAEEKPGHSGPFGFAQGRRDDRVREEKTGEQSGKSVALGRKSPPIAEGAKGGHPQDRVTDGASQIEEHSQEWLCHKEQRQKLEGEDLEVALAGEDYA